MSSIATTMGDAYQNALQKSRQCTLENMIAYPGFHGYPPPCFGTFISRRLPLLEGVGKQLYPPLFSLSPLPPLGFASLARRHANSLCAWKANPWTALAD